MTEGDAPNVERLNMDRPNAAHPFDAYYYAHGCGRPYQRDEEWLRFFGSVAERIASDIRPSTVLDAGCAMGFVVEALRDRGVDAYGIDISEYAIQQVREDIRPYCWIGSVTEPFPRKYDLIVSIEVLEHMSSVDAAQAIANFCRHTDDVLISSTPSDYKEATHFNVQPPEYWAEQFARHGFIRDVDFDASFLTPWAVRFRRNSEPLPRIVREYERRFSLLWKESCDLRALSVEMRNQLAVSEQADQSLRQQLTEADKAAQSQSAKAIEAEKAVQSLTGQIMEREQSIRSLKTQIAVIKASTSWRLLQRLWPLRRIVAPPGTWRERMWTRLKLALNVWSQHGFGELVRTAFRRLLRRPATTASPQNTGAVPSPSSARETSTGSPTVPAEAGNDLRVALYTTDRWASACAMIRVIGPSLHPQSGLQVIEGSVWDKSPQIVLPAEAEAVVVQRDFPRHEALYQQVVSWARSAGKPVIYELDDLLLELPPEHTEKSYYDGVRALMLQALIQADAVVVSTLGLADYARRLNPNTWLLPNYLDDRLWAVSQDSGRRGSGPVVLGYMSGPAKSHQPDLAIVLPVLTRLLQRYGGRIRLHFWGLLPPELAEHPSVDYSPEIFHEYPDFARYFMNQKSDIFIAPLRDNLFNRCKSPIKFLEYSALGVPGVYSNLATYAGVVSHGQNGFLAATPQEWEDCLSLLIEDGALRRSMGQAARQTVLDGFLMSKHAHEWGTVYRSALAAAGGFDRTTAMERAKLHLGLIERQGAW